MTDQIDRIKVGEDKPQRETKKERVVGGIGKHDL